MRWPNMRSAAGLNASIDPLASITIMPSTAASISARQRASAISTSPPPSKTPAAGRQPAPPEFDAEAPSDGEEFAPLGILS